MKLHITVTSRNAVSALLLLIIPYFPGIASLISDLSKGISGQQIENQKTRKCLKDVFRRGGQGILIPFHELRKITEPGNQLKAGFAAG